MEGKHGSINKIANDAHNAKTTMMDMWKDSLARSQRLSQTASKVSQNPSETKADLEQKVRNGQSECQTCKNRVYKDESHDGGVSFQAAKGLSASTAGIRVMSHEHEHVSAENTDPDKTEGNMRTSTTALEYGKCPECGKTYVKGGVTKTTSRPASYRKQGFDVSV